MAKRKSHKLSRPSAVLSVMLGAAILLMGCVPSQTPADVVLDPAATVTRSGGPTPLPTRTLLAPGQLVAYTAATGDTLPALASHFNTTVEEILKANPAVPSTATTLPPGYPLQIPAYNLPLTGTPFKIIPNSELVNGPSAVSFDLRAEVLGRPGYLGSSSDWAFSKQRPGWQVVNVVAENFSVNPRLLLTLLEYGSKALTDPFPDSDAKRYSIGYHTAVDTGLYRQLSWAAQRLNEGYYGWSDGTLREFETTDGYLVRPDPWQNAGTVAVQYLFAGMDTLETFDQDIGPEGLYKTYVGLWGDPFAKAVDIIPANLEQPPLALPFEPGKIWDFTGGPHSSWGEGPPYGALDFAPPAAETGCAPSGEWVTAPAGGIITRSEEALAVLDLDGDGDARTGWVMIFYHLAPDGKIATGTHVKPGDFIGHPSCQGGQATGTHVHVARRYNGQWISAGGVVPFNLDGWIAHAGDAPYQGTLTKASNVIPACTCTSMENRIIYTLPGQ